MEVYALDSNKKVLSRNETEETISSDEELDVQGD